VFCKYTQIHGISHPPDLPHIIMPHHTTKTISRKPMMASVSDKQKVIMPSLERFFIATALQKNGLSRHMEVFLSQVSKGAPISLRVIDWFVTNYSREHDVSYVNAATGRTFNVHKEYKTRLKSYTKRQFDPFCRRNRINFYYSEGAVVLTTVGQLNFFKWAIENHVLEYIEKHLPEIEKAMRKFVRAQRDERRSADDKGGKGSASKGNLSKTRKRTSETTPSGGGSGVVAQRRTNQVFTQRAPITVCFS
jgi:hypothetical protein